MELVVQIRGMGPEPVGPAAGEPPSPDDPATKLEANYRPSEVENETCGTCTHFGRNRCELVVGVIKDDYVCDWWSDAETVAPQQAREVWRAV